MHFSLGRPILVLIVVALITGFGVLEQKPLARQDLTVWCFSENHEKTYRDPLLKRTFFDQTHLTYDAILLSQQSLDIRLVSMFMSPPRPEDSPDVCEIEISSIGKYLKPPVEDVALLPLDDLLDKSGWRSRIVASRFAPWSKVDSRTGKTVCFGIPCDTNPVALTYRKDLFDKAGLDPAQAKTWPAFQQMCLDYQAYWAAHGKPGLRALDMATITQADIVNMLLQRHINVVDPQNQVHFDDPKLLDTVVFFSQMVAGNRAVATDPSPGVSWTTDIDNGTFAGTCAADWQNNYIERYAPDVAGKMRVIPLPKFEDSDAPTSTYGGTMMGIPRTCPHPEQAWKLIELLALSKEATQARIRNGSQTLPAVPELLSDPAYHQPDPFFAPDTPDGPGQKVSELYVKLSTQIPERYVTPYTAAAEMALVAVIQKAKDYLAVHPDGQGLKEACAGWLADAQRGMEAEIQFAEFKQ